MYNVSQAWPAALTCVIAPVMNATPLPLKISPSWISPCEDTHICHHSRPEVLKEVGDFASSSLLGQSLQTLLVVTNQNLKDATSAQWVETRHTVEHRALPRCRLQQTSTRTKMSVVRR